MSVKADVKIMLLASDYKLLEIGMSTQGFNEDELCLWNNRREERFTKGENEFVMLSWNYVRWDHDTDEVVAKIVDYLYGLQALNMPCRYIAIYDVGTEEEICSYGKDPDIIPYIAGCMYIAKEIKTNDSFYELCD